jgi:hypothetical protein
VEFKDPTTELTTNETAKMANPFTTCLKTFSVWLFSFFENALEGKIWPNQICGLVTIVAKTMPKFHPFSLYHVDSKKYFNLTEKFFEIGHEF